MNAVSETGIAGLQEVKTFATDPAAIGLRTVVIGANALDDLMSVVDSLLVGPRRTVLLVMDAVQYRRCGQDLKDLVASRLSTRHLVRRAVLGGDTPQRRVHADETTLAFLYYAARGADLLVTVGSGTLVDLGKAAAAQRDLPHVVVQTAASVNGFADDQSVLLRDGAKRTTPTRWPDALLVDADVIRDAPVSLNAAGVGDLLSMFVAPADWLLSSALGLGARYSSELVDLVRVHGPRLLSLARDIENGAPEALLDLTRLLTLSGLTMGAAGCTSPSSGSEHVISHLLEMRLGSRSAWHGAQVGVATVVASALWARVRAHLRTGEIRCHIPETDVARARVLSAFADLEPKGRTAEECWNAYSRKLNWLRSHAGHLEAFLGDWSRIDSEVDRLLVTPEQLTSALHDTPIPLRFGDLGPQYDRPTVAWAVANAHLMRDRFTVADLADLLGIWNHGDVEALLDGLAQLGAGA
ncbi:iron-containing alcohol dehydrogenase [Kribbella sp. NPDC004536]|uniref:iron-containing alcohol dehydrogenase n=1 Tax=Kribbella sp. NPDC004536 TaxID=3364106 RepID=UPI0036BC951E